MLTPGHRTHSGSGGPGPTQPLLLVVLTKVITPDDPCWYPQAPERCGRMGGLQWASAARWDSLGQRVVLRVEVTLKTSEKERQQQGQEEGLGARIAEPKRVRKTAGLQCREEHMHEALRVQRSGLPGQHMECVSPQHGGSCSWQACEGAHSGTKRPKGEAGLQGARRETGSDVSPNLGRVDGRLATTQKVLCLSPLL